MHAARELNGVSASQRMAADQLDRQLHGFRRELDDVNRSSILSQGSESASTADEIETPFSIPSGQRRTDLAFRDAAVGERLVTVLI
jgi:uncharacterized coiled-coil protein SlyX